MHFNATSNLQWLETLLAQCRTVMQEIPSDIRESFVRIGLIQYWYYNPGEAHSWIAMRLSTRATELRIQPVSETVKRKKVADG
jgi:hypothetical protein